MTLMFKNSHANHISMKCYINYNNVSRELGLA